MCIADKIMARTKFVIPLNKKGLEPARLPLSSHLKLPATGSGGGDVDGDDGLQEVGVGLQQLWEDQVREDQLQQVGEHLLQQVVEPLLQQVVEPIHEVVGGDLQLAAQPANILEADLGGLGMELVVKVLGDSVGETNNKFMNFKSEQLFYISL